MSLENQKRERVIPVELPVVLIDKAVDFKFATVELIERWEKAFEKIEIEGKISERTVKLDEIANVFSNLNEKTIVAFGNYVIDNITLEKICETIYPLVQENEIYFLKNKEGDISPVFVAGADVLKLISCLDYKSENILQDIFSECESSDKISVFVEEIGRSFWGKITDKDSVDRAEWGFLKFLKTRPSGILAEYIYNSFSIRITRHLLKHKWITPNLVTTVDFFIGLLALTLFFIKTNHYFFGILAILILEFNVVLDCVDGEIARVRLQTSQFGANLDSFSDETIASLTQISIGYHLMTMGLQNRFLIESKWFLYIGIFNGLVSYFYAMINFHSRHKHKGVGFYFWWDLNKSIKVRRRKKTVGFYLKHLMWRESIVFFLLFFAIFKLFDIFLILSCLMSSVVLVLIFIHIFIKKAAW